jgi:arylsulfatase A-like enzyme
MCKTPRRLFHQLSHLSKGIKGVLWVLLIGSGGVAAERPNVLVIFTDDQPYKTIGCYPEAPDWVMTPNIDRLAEAGVRFERAYLGSWCMPSRASLLTGRLQHGIESMRMEGTYPGSAYDPKRCPFVPAEFRRQGYHTAHIGKWHTGVDGGFGRDWDHQVIWNRPKYPENAGAYFTGQILEIDGRQQPDRMNGYSTDFYTDRAVGFIEGADRPADKPWFLWLCYGAVHGPTTPAGRHQGQYDGNPPAIPADIFGPRPGKPAYLAGLQAWEPGPDKMPQRIPKKRLPTSFDANTPGQTLADWVEQVNECALAIDDGVGRLLAALEQTGQLANTLVVFTSDQGFALGEHGCSIKLCPYDANIASPLIVSQPGTIPAGAVVRRSVNGPDITATLCDHAGVEVPWKIHGRSFRDLLIDPATPAGYGPPMLLTSTGRAYGSATANVPDAEHIYDHAGVPWWVMLRAGKFKYIRCLVEGETEEVYDLETDPDELHNLVCNTNGSGPRIAPALLERLRRAAVEELKRTDAPFVSRLPAVKGMKGQ